MKLKTARRCLILATVMLGQISQPGFCKPSAGDDGEGQTHKHGKATTPDMRVKKQFKRIEMGLKSGKLTEAQANKLRNLVSAVEQDIKAKRAANGGELKEEEKVRIENVLKQNANQINTALGAGTSLGEGPDVLGPEWKPGPDGAQNPKALLKQMKAQEKRALRQEKQANEQALEQQQLDYDKEVIYNLSQQKAAVQKKKKELENVRKESGAN